MQIQNENSGGECSRLQEYLDDELSFDEDRTFETHLETCSECRFKVSLHSQLTGGFETFPEERIELPEDFSKVVAANAESQVNGLRKRGERKVTFAILAGLAVLLFVVLGVNFAAASRVAIFILEQFLSVVLVIGSFIADFFLGIFVIAKVAATQFDISAAGVAKIFGILLGVFLFACLVRAGRSLILGDAKR